MGRSWKLVPKRGLIDFDEGASYLGEVALAPNDSAIRKSGTLFYNPLYDENASCHFALGMGLGECIRGGESMSQEELTAKHRKGSSLLLERK